MMPGWNSYRFAAEIPSIFGLLHQKSRGDLTGSERGRDRTCNFVLLNKHTKQNQRTQWVKTMKTNIGSIRSISI